jgi:predicted nucleic acid-binding protein
LIVVDTAILAHMTFPTRHSAAVSALHEKNSVWEAPALWKIEFLNVLALYVKKGVLDHSESLNALDYAERLIGSREHAVDPRQVINAMADSSCSSYDCTFVVLAQHLDTNLITYDKKLLREFPRIAITPERYLEQ